MSEKIKNDRTDTAAIFARRAEVQRRYAEWADTAPCACLTCWMARNGGSVSDLFPKNAK